MTKSEFQMAHGPTWSKIVAEPAFFAALQICGAERLSEIENLSAAEIEAHGKVHLANFQGHLKTESILLNLAVESQVDGFDLPPADYGAPAPGEEPAVEPSDLPVFTKPPQRPTKASKRKTK